MQNNSQRTQTAKSSQKSTRVKSAIERAGLLQQREQLRQMLINKFNSDFAKGNKQKEQQIIDIVNEYFKNEKVTEQSLKELKARVMQSLSSKPPINNKASMPSIVQQQNFMEPQQSEVKSVRPQSVRSQKKDFDQISVTSSQLEKPPKSVYVVDEEDEWAALVKFDTQLYQKELSLEQQRQLEFKKKMKHELDKQLEEKKKRKEVEKREEEAYVRLAKHQMEVYDEREDWKKKEKERKQRQEKELRDRQVREDEKRKLHEKRKQQELDAILLSRIKDELKLEQREVIDKKTLEKQQFLDMMKENERNRMKQESDQRNEKIQEVEMQQKYLQLQERLEQEREMDKKEREDKIKRIMGNFSESVQNQKDIIKYEDEKMIKNMMLQNQIEQEKEEIKKKQQKLQQLEMRNYLNKQMEDKKQRMKEEENLDKRQAQIWANDLQMYSTHEKNKFDYIKEVNLKHQDILKQQMEEKRQVKGPRSVKMTPAELMQNKPLLRELADKQDGIKVRKINIESQ